MKLEVTGKQLDTGEALREHIAEKMQSVVDKYFERTVEAKVTLSRDAHLFVCECQAHLATGLLAKSSAKDSEVYAACDKAIARLEKQLRRYKRRLKDHHQKRKEPVDQVEASSYVLSGQFDEDTTEEAGGEGQFWSPAIIAEGTESIPKLSVGEAVMQMELKNSDVLLFINDAHQRLNAVYRREDGNIGWIDPATRK